MYTIKLEIQSEIELIHSYDMIQASIDKYGREKVKNDTPGIYELYKQIKIHYPRAIDRMANQNLFSYPLSSK